MQWTQTIDSSQATKRTDLKQKQKFVSDQAWEKLASTKRGIVSDLHGKPKQQTIL
jgi:hypothetical protein